jgi:transposase
MKTLGQKTPALPRAGGSTRGSKRKQTGVTPVIGLDIGDQFSHWCTLDSSGEVEAEGRLRTTERTIGSHFAALPPSLIAIEAGTHSAWIERELRAVGHEVIVANPRELRKIHTSDRKNDRADAEILARMARFDPKLLAPIHHRTAQMQADLTSIRVRDAVMRARTMIINALRGSVKTSGSRLPKCDADYFAKKAVSHVPEELREALAPAFEILEHITKAIGIRPTHRADGYEQVPRNRAAPATRRSWDPNRGHIPVDPG